jgi:hypothetical protein
MKSHLLLANLALLFLTNSAYAVQSTITDAEGYSCMGDDKSRKQTEQAAMIDAKKNAAEYTSTYIKSETQVKDFAFQNDLVTAYTNAEVTVIEDLEKGWYKDPSSGDCFRIKIKAEVIPDQNTMERIASASTVTGTGGNVSIPVAPPPVPDSGSPATQGTATAPDVVVVPSGTTYVYMVPTTTGLYFYNGYWFRNYEGYWFQTPTYGRSWVMVNPDMVPRSVVNVPPEYPRYLPSTYTRIHSNDLHQHWQDWDRTKEWNKHDWFINEMKPEVIQERQALIRQEQAEHRIKRERKRQTREYVVQQREHHRLQMEHIRQEAKQQQRAPRSIETVHTHHKTNPNTQYNQRPDRSSANKRKAKKESAEKQNTVKKDKQVAKSKNEHHEKKID